jgi:hypothetical protein
MTVVPLRLPSHRGRAASLALAVALAAVCVATPSRALPAQASEGEQLAVLRLTQTELHRFTSATKALAALIRRDPAAGRALGEGTSPAASRIFADAGMTRDGYLRFFGALFEATSASYVLETDPSAAAQMTSVVKANVSFVRKHKAAIDALGPDIRTIQKSGEEG